MEPDVRDRVVERLRTVPQRFAEARHGDARIVLQPSVFHLELDGAAEIAYQIEQV